MRRLTVIALGGNALIRAGERGTVEEQMAHLEETVAPIASVAARGLPLIITHGNGPMIGQSLIRGELARNEVPVMPLHVMDAETQGNIGFLIQQAFSNRLWLEGVGRESACVITRVVVDATDPSFADPTKPVGLFYSREEAELLTAERGWVMAEDSGRGYRRRVPSPMPLRIPEARVIGGLAKRGVVTVAAGGGGVPVVDAGDGTLRGVDAVVDKDRATALLSHEAGAERLLILTSVDRVYTGFGTPAQRGLTTIGVGEAEELLAQGEFPSGSMGPKIQAATGFLRGGGREVRIGLPEQLADVLSGDAGTLITPHPDDARDAQTSGPGIERRHT
jgi:carbamate kinase